MTVLEVGKMYETKALQHEAEILAFCDLVRSLEINSYLEIGSKFGGSLWRVAQAMLPKSRVVAIDLPNGTKLWRQSEPSLMACVDRLNQLGHDAHVIWGDSTDPVIIEKARSFGPYDLILIDGDHRLPGLTADWNNYGPMGQVIAFHDISWDRPPDFAVYHRIDVPEFWKYLRVRYNSLEIRKDPTGRDNGIGVLWRDRPL